MLPLSTAEDSIESKGDDVVAVLLDLLKTGNASTGISLSNCLVFFTTLLGLYILVVVDGVVVVVVVLVVLVNKFRLTALALVFVG